MSLPTPIIQVLLHFRPTFTRPTWDKALVLVVGTILARGRRTVTAALKQMGLHNDEDFTLFHQVLNRASWSCLTLSRLLLHLLVSTFVGAGGTVEIAIDETLERRWGRKIAKRGHYRDSVQSSKEQSVSTSGLRWVVMMLVVQVPWSSRAWALPFFSVLATTPRVSAELGKPHKTVGEIAQQMVMMVMMVRRWLPDIPVSLVGDTAYSILELGLCCAKHQVTLIAPMRWDSSLHEPAPSRKPGTIGRPRVKGAALPKLSNVLADPNTEWLRVRVRWYDGLEQELELASGIAVWYRIGSPVLPVRWVLTRDPAGQREPRAYFCTGQSLSAVEVVSHFIKRWTIEVTFEERVRRLTAHLGVETQRQWSDLAIERSTPCLLGMFSLVALFGQVLYPDGEVPVQRTAWYDKREATFSDVLAAVRRQLWGNFTFQTSPTDPDVCLVPRSHVERLAYAVCY